MRVDIHSCNDNDCHCNLFNHYRINNDGHCNHYNHHPNNNDYYYCAVLRRGRSYQPF